MSPVWSPVWLLNLKADQMLCLFSLTKVYRPLADILFSSCSLSSVQILTVGLTILSCLSVASFDEQRMERTELVSTPGFFGIRYNCTVITTCCIRRVCERTVDQQQAKLGFHEPGI